MEVKLLKQQMKFLFTCIFLSRGQEDIKQESTSKNISAGDKFYEGNTLKECDIWDYFIWSAQKDLLEEVK